ncbi:hypothetical protein MVLG_04642 [Microbotryum lychnidis-dioicae p1A1 Lamole]|uniref:Uncharacterized protein n=1 Tax=Microbotryum lychnidis-dioicae (strain p1A1 Lamole / MvSl-1064) TaxID=683840 RepID=U5HBU9_USTV1|nr:hypothetical protein MVLG_04642 [Microbotryum lychnidis-dioicae p1A1 Lamole]|eukprot:KDE04995.1 hypothetical protein MVLG_04642 [Microbotryum lychnidis-dioicae p1A1 Lamole]
MFSRAAVRASRQAFARRSYSTASSHASPTAQSSDAIWMIGSAAVFVPTIFYLTRPPAVAAQHAHTDKDDHVSPSRKEIGSSPVPKAFEPEKEEETPESEPASESDSESEPEADSKSSTSDADKPSNDAERDVKTTAEAATANAAEEGHSSAHEMKTHKSSGPKDVHEAAKTAQQSFTKEKEEGEEEK